MDLLLVQKCKALYCRSFMCPPSGPLLPFRLQPPPGQHRSLSPSQPTMPRQPRSPRRDSQQVTHTHPPPLEDPEWLGLMHRLTPHTPLHFCFLLPAVPSFLYHPSLPTSTVISPCVFNVLFPFPFLPGFGALGYLLYHIHIYKTV